jgi:hypothetical protein
MSNANVADPVARFAEAIEGAAIPRLDVFAPGVEVDATVPNWRMSYKGSDNVREAFSQWYADPGHFDEVRRSTLPSGELLEFTFTWEEGGIPHTCHQAHVLELSDGQIVADRVWCGGRWPASLMAEMAAAS